MRFKRKTVRAIDSNGKLDSHYDTVREKIRRRCRLWSRKTTEIKYYEKACEIIDPQQQTPETLLDAIGIQTDLRISLFANLLPILGIASVLNHPQLIDSNTRVLYYSAIARRETDRRCFIERLFDYFFRPRQTTHRISSIEYGIDVLIIWHFPKDTNFSRIDRSLEKIQERLRLFNDIDVNLIEDLQSSSETKMTPSIYSNIPNNEETENLYKLFNLIGQMRKGEHQGYPVSYVLEPIEKLKWIFHFENTQEIQFDSHIMSQIDTDLLEIRKINRNVEEFHRIEQTNKRYQFSEKLLDKIRKICTDLETRYNLLIRNFGTKIIDSRTNRGLASSTIENQLEETMKDFSSRSRYLIQYKLIANTFRGIEIKFEHISEYKVDHQQDLKAIENVLLDKNPDALILCTNDDLLEEIGLNVDRLAQIVMQEKHLDPSTYFIHVDFTNSNVRLEQMIIFPSTIIKDYPGNTTSLPLPSIDPEPMINVLLLGQTGVGKSTFINALRNYLKYSSLDDAEKKQDPIVVIPVFFIITSGYYFDKRVMKFGQCSNAENENFNEPGQSVTQECQEHIFDLRSMIKQKIRFIDTPGFNDTRGLKQDRMNMRNILKYIRAFPRIDAVCFLLKSNETRLTVGFCSCFNRFAKIVKNMNQRKVFFCFTNSSATSYQPGNTGPLIQKFLLEQNITGIQLDKSTGFCFDSESFRYFVARRNNVEFKNTKRETYQKSWENSSNESVRLIQCISELNASKQISDKTSF